MPETYNILLTGAIAEGHDLQQVKAKIGQLFKLEDRKVAAMFVGKPIVVRRGVNQQQAKKLQAALAKTGAVVKIKPSAVPPATAVADSNRAVANDKPQPPAAEIQCPRCGYQQAHSTACGQCKMDLKLHLVRLQRKEKMRLIRQQAS